MSGIDLGQLAQLHELERVALRHGISEGLAPLLQEFLRRMQGMKWDDPRVIAVRQQFVAGGGNRLSSNVCKGQMGFLEYHDAAPAVPEDLLFRDGHFACDDYEFGNNWMISERPHLIILDRRVHYAGQYEKLGMKTPSEFQREEETYRSICRLTDAIIDLPRVSDVRTNGTSDDDQPRNYWFRTDDGGRNLGTPPKPAQQTGGLFMTWREGLALWTHLGDAWPRGRVIACGASRYKTDPSLIVTIGRENGRPVIGKIREDEGAPNLGTPTIMV